MPALLAPIEHRARRRVGTMLGGKYLLERVLGAGGMAAVYEGVHRNGNRVAIKVLHADALFDPDTVTRFRREGYVANSLGHPGAVRVLDDDVDADGLAFLVMELLVGETLFTRAKRLGGRLSVREALAIGCELCHVLAAAHDKGVIHRDIKPENLFLTTTRVLKVLDFGIARVAEGPDGRATNAGTALGTPAFMPPEQALGYSREVDARSDLWSAGATLFALLSGQLVHQAETASALLVAAATRPARSLAIVAPDVPVPVIAAVDRALRFDREERWSSAASMASALAEAHEAVFGERLTAAAIGPVPAEHVPASRPAAELSFAATKEATAPSLPLVSGAGSGEPGPHTTAAPGRVTRPTGAVTGRAERESAPTLLATDPAPAPSTSGPAQPPRATLVSAPPPPSPAPAHRGGRVLAVVLALVVAAALSVTRLRQRSGTPAVPLAGRAPCTSDGDCGALAAGWACGPAGRCVERPGCADNRACTAAVGQPAICRRDLGVCVALASEDCSVRAEPGDLVDDATLWIGAMFPLTGPDAQQYGLESMDSVELARRDFSETVSGLPPARPGGPRRPLAVVACNDAVDPARAAAHLVGALHVPVVIGFHRSKEVADLAASHFTPGGVLALAANTASMLRSIPHAPDQPRMVWRTTTSSDMALAPRAALLSEVIEPELRARPGLLSKGEPIRVALVRIANATGLGVADGHISALRFNGKSVAENGDSFRQVTFADGLDEAGFEAETRRVAAELAGYQPHVILGTTNTSSFVSAVERSWPLSARFRPRYLSGSVGPAFLEEVRRIPDLPRRVFRVDTVTDSAVLAKFVHRHNEVFPSSKVTLVDAKPAAYDAFYLAAYAMAALGAEPVTGVALARALPRLLPPGEPIDVGPGGIFGALAALGSGRAIDLDGAVTTLDFDLESGDARANMAIFCLAPGKNGALPAFVESGLVFPARTGKLEGALRCP